MKKRGSGFPWFIHSLVKGDSYPELAHSAMLRAEDFLISFFVAEAEAEVGFLGACGLHIRRPATFWYNLEAALYVMAAR
jgi:hypothetical protein